MKTVQNVLRKKVDYYTDFRLLCDICRNSYQNGFLWVCATCFEGIYVVESVFSMQVTCCVS